MLLQRPEVSESLKESTNLELEPNVLESIREDAFKNLVGTFDTHWPQIRLNIGEKSLVVSGL